MTEHTTGEHPAENDARCQRPVIRWHGGEAACHYPLPCWRHPEQASVTSPAVPATPDAGEASEPKPGTLAYAQMVAERHGDLDDAAIEDGVDPTPAASTDASEGLSEAERDALIDTIADGRVADSIAQHGPAKDHALLHRVLRAECARFVEHAEPEVERIVAARVSAAATKARAEALREAADEWGGTERVRLDTVAKWLRDRADTLAPDTAGGDR